jgi:DNA-binding transcriptional regulator GbsR (MarR family)
VDPTLTVLRDLILREPANEAERHAQQRLAGMTEAIELLTSWADEVQKLPDERITALLKLGAGVAKVLDAGAKLRLLPGGRPRKKES